MPENQPDLKQPRYYTHEELQNTPFEQWQKDRVPEELREYYDIVSSQLQGRYAQQQIQQRPANPPMFEPPRNYTPKELSEEAQKIAVQRLGLEISEEANVPYHYRATFDWEYAPYLRLVGKNDNTVATVHAEVDRDYLVNAKAGGRTWQ